jgi:hypothetical protein
MRFEMLFAFGACTAMGALETLNVGVRISVKTQRLFVFEAFSANKAKMVFGLVNISSMFPQEIHALEFHAAIAANAALGGGEFRLFFTLPKSAN